MSKIPNEVNIIISTPSPFFLEMGGRKGGRKRSYSLRHFRGRFILIAACLNQEGSAYLAVKALQMVTSAVTLDPYCALKIEVKGQCHNSDSDI